MNTAAAVPTTADQPTPNAEPVARVLEVRFTGSGSEYFRIWAINLLLILLSCGLYLPFAKIRRIRYLYANTLIDGEALAFHGDAGKMFRGFVLLAVLMLAYTLAGEFAPAAALPAFVLLCVVWPALWRASMQFRLGNTSWRGLRFGFEGSLTGAYLAHLPVYIPMAVLTALVPDGQGPSSDPGVNSQFWFAVTLALLCLMAPWSTVLLKRYQHRGYRVAGERSEIVLRTRSVYFIGFKTVMAGVAMFLLAIVAAAIVTGCLLVLAHFGGVEAKSARSYFGLACVGLLYLFGAGGLLPYYAARIQNLVWGNTRSASLRFHSELTGLTRLNLRNWLLIVLTLGLYRPFAAMATTRLRLQAVRIASSTDPATWTASRAGRHADASGDVAGDFFGMDVGL
ncbi:YjgN family protein [Pelomonas sp. Root1444]|uniref:YjgN family protein n=1 Tax=Pelomonas sp. Root1444 TaxID=1736464 RepID=UPI000703A0CA|nr:YjgN family protein [Pelomonas sp. Root1444]KQY90294.1 hypothetical protein ASD35_00325 [Pelomonas sp. Root1444]